MLEITIENALKYYTVDINTHGYGKISSKSKVLALNPFAFELLSSAFSKLFSRCRSLVTESEIENAQYTVHYTQR